MNPYTLETGEFIYLLRCDCCNQEKKRVFGFVSKDGDAHSVYYALLNVTEEKPRVGLTVSVGHGGEIRIHPTGSGFTLKFGLKMMESTWHCVTHSSRTSTLGHEVAFH